MALRSRLFRATHPTNIRPWTSRTQVNNSFSAVRHGCLRRIGWFSPKNGSLGSKGGAVSAEFHIFSRSPRVRPEHWTLWLSVLTKKSSGATNLVGPGAGFNLRWTLPLEAIAQRELQGALQARFAGDHAELARRRIKIRAAQGGGIDEVVGLGAELETVPLGDLERLQQGQVPILQARLVDGVAHAGRQVEGARGRLRDIGGAILGRSRGGHPPGKSPGVDGRRATEVPELPFGTAA